MTLTDAVQLVFIVLGLIVLALTVLSALAGVAGIGAGLERLVTEVPAEKLTLIPTDRRVFTRNPAGVGTAFSLFTLALKSYEAQVMGLPMSGGTGCARAPCSRVIRSC